jgi:hypothetical protein
VGFDVEAFGGRAAIDGRERILVKEQPFMAA